MKLSIDSVLSTEETRWSGLRELLLLALPVIITIGSNTVMNAADAWMVSHQPGMGTDNIAAILPAGILNHVLVSFFIGVLSCVSTFAGQCYGKRELQESAHYGWQGIHLSAYIAIGALAFYPLSPYIFKAMNHEANVQTLETTYFGLRLFGIGGAVMSVALGSFFTAVSRPIVPMVATITANIFNLVGDYALIFGKFGFPEMGIAGAAIATNIAAWLCVLIMFSVFISRTFSREFHTRKAWRWDWPKAKQLFRIGWPAGLTMGMDVLSWTVFSTLIVGYFGTNALAAGSVTGQLLAGSFMPTIAVGIAVTALVGQWIGRRDLERSVARVKTGLKVGVVYMSLMSLVFVVFGEKLTAFFRPDNPEVIRLGGRFLMLAAAFQFFDAVGIISGGGLKGAGDTKWPMIAHVLTAWLLFLPLAFILSFGLSFQEPDLFVGSTFSLRTDELLMPQPLIYTRLGVYGGWVAAVVYIWVLGALYFWRFFSRKWQTIDIFKKAKENAIVPIIDGPLEPIPLDNPLGIEPTPPPPKVQPTETFDDSTEQDVSKNIQQDSNEDEDEFQQISQIDKQYVWHPFTQMKEWMQGEQLMIAEGDGALLRDTDGNEYIDGVSSIWCNVHGHCRKEINDAVKAQLDRVAHSTLLGLGNVPSAEFAEKLVEITPENLTRVFYSDNGATSVEIALKIAFQYQQQRPDPKPGKIRFLAIRNGYHGDTIGSVGVGGVELFHSMYKPMLMPTYFAPSPYCYRCPLNKTPDDCKMACADELERMVEEHADELAAVVMEPLMQGAGGIITHPKGFLSRVREITCKHDLLLIADEVAVGFGRTGRMFACEHENVQPDLLTLSKGISGGYMPLAATLTTDEIFEAFLGEPHECRTFFHGHTYTGNPLACAAGLASLKIFEEEKTLEKLQPRIRHFSQRLEEISRLEHVGDVRQCGFIAGIELVADRETKQPYPSSEKVGRRTILATRPHGVIVRNLDDVVVIFPPLCISDEQIDQLMDAVRDAIIKTTNA